MTDIDSASGVGKNAALSSDAHGHAALLLVESLIHGLCERATLTTRDAVKIVERAISVQHDYADAADGDGASARQALMLLQTIAASLETDDGGASVR